MDSAFGSNSFNFCTKLLTEASFIAYGDEQGRALRGYPSTGEIYEVSPGRTTLTLISVHGIPVSPANQVVKPITDTAEIYIQNHSDSSQKKAHFGYLVDVFEMDFMTRVEFVHTVDTEVTSTSSC